MPTHPAHCIKARGIDMAGAGIDDILANEGGEHTAKDDLAALPDLDRGVATALERNGRFGDPRAVHGPARHRGESSLCEFIDMARKGNRGRHHRRHVRIIDNVDRELLGRANIPGRILESLAGLVFDAECQDRRIRRERVEKTVGGCIDNTLRADRGHPGDRAGHDGADQELVTIAGRHGREIKVMMVHAKTIP